MYSGHLTFCWLPLHCVLLLSDKQCGTGSPLTPPASCKPTSNCPTALKDQQVLTAWKAVLSDPAGRLSSWQGANPCNPSQPWTGVQCSEDGFDVVGVDLSGSNLTGTLPEAESLTSLKVLLLNKNPRLTGTLPAGRCCTQVLTNDHVLPKSAHTYPVEAPGQRAIYISVKYCSWCDSNSYAALICKSRQLATDFPA
jgi:hypothetical protein